MITALFILVLLLLLAIIVGMLIIVQAVLELARLVRFMVYGIESKRDN